MRRILLICAVILFTQTILAKSRIYLIRHAEVDLEKPGWCTSKKAVEYKNHYAEAPIVTFNGTEVLKKIDQIDLVDTVFCSTLPRAVVTALTIFGQSVEYKGLDMLRELDYPVVRLPVLHLPLKLWLGFSRATWMAGLNKKDKTPFNQKKEEIEYLAAELERYALDNKITVVVAHGMLNRQLIRTLQKKGWELEQFEGYKNLSVNCLIK